ncbi:MAG TPA: hypothetical protein VK604_01985 [Bryobacteraceae bacterium]|nr:hypothetical protein [Bryobacteraceae bacterium]
MEEFYLGQELISLAKELHADPERVSALGSLGRIEHLTMLAFGLPAPAIYSSIPSIQGALCFGLSLNGFASRTRAGLTVPTRVLAMAFTRLFLLRIERFLAIASNLRGHPLRGARPGH